MKNYMHDAARTHAIVQKPAPSYHQLGAPPSVEKGIRGRCSEKRRGREIFVTGGFYFFTNHPFSLRTRLDALLTPAPVLWISRGAGASPLFFPLMLAMASSSSISSSSSLSALIDIESRDEDGSFGNERFFSLFALRKEAGVMFGDSSSEESGVALRWIFLVDFGGGTPFLNLVTAALRRRVVAGFLRAPNLETLCWTLPRRMLNVAWRVEVMTPARRLDEVVGLPRFIARFSRDAI